MPTSTANGCSLGHFGSPVSALSGPLLTHLRRGAMSPSRRVDGTADAIPSVPVTDLEARAERVRAIDLTQASSVVNGHTVARGGDNVTTSYYALALDFG